MMDIFRVPHGKKVSSRHRQNMEMSPFFRLLAISAICNLTVIGGGVLLIILL
jgi:hypothetical protein